MSQSTETVPEKVEKVKKQPQKAPKGWIRWSGLGVFVLVAGAVVGLMYLGITQVLKNQIEHYASQAWGAKVEIGHLDLGVMPLKVGVRDLQMTDPDKPMENLVVLKEASASLNVYHLVVGRTVIEDIVFQDLAFHQPRQTSGALSQVEEVAPSETVETEAPPSESAGFEMPSMALPDVDAVMQRETLQTVETAEAIESQLNTVSSTWSDMKAQVPNSQEMASYEQRIRALSEGKIDSLEDLQAKQKAFEALKTELQTRQKAIEEGRDYLQKSLPALQQDVAELKTLPDADYRRLSDKFSLNEQGMSNWSYLLFGEKIQGWTDEALYWYEKAKPFIAKLQAMRAEQAQAEAASQAKRALGEDVVYDEKDPQPDFIIKRIQGTSTSDWGQVTANLQQVTFDHPKTQKPILFQVTALPQGQSNPLTLSGQSNFIDSDNPINFADLAWQAYRIQDWTLSSEAALPVVMQQGTTDVSGRVDLIGVSEVKAIVKMAYHDVVLDTGASDSKDVQRYLAPVLKDIKQFDVASEVSGTIYAPKVGAKSNLDKLLSKAMDKVWQTELKQTQADLKRQLNDTLQTRLAPIDQQLSELLGDQVELTSDYNKIQSMLATQLQSETDKQKKAAEDAAKKEAEKLIKDKADELKNMFKF